MRTYDEQYWLFSREEPECDGVQRPFSGLADTPEKPRQGRRPLTLGKDEVEPPL